MQSKSWRLFSDQLKHVIGMGWGIEEFSSANRLQWIEFGCFSGLFAILSRIFRFLPWSKLFLGGRKSISTVLTT